MRTVDYVWWTGGFCQKCRPILADTSKMTNLYAPGGEPALAPELAELAGDGHHRVGRGLVGQVVKLGAGDPQPRAAPPALPLRTPSGERTEPPGRLTINRVSHAGSLINPARLDALQARADEGVYRIAAGNAAREAHAQYAARLEREAHAQAEPPAECQAEASDGIEIEL
jgi:hypothetical protein